MTDSTARKKFEGHTPGPWEMHPVSSVVGSLISWGDISKGENVCAVMPQKHKAVCEANACLIAAAPDLLKELEAQSSELADLKRRLQNADKEQEQIYAENIEAEQEISRLKSAQKPEER